MLEHKRKNLKFLIEHYRDKEDLSKEYLVKQIAFLSSLLPEKKVKTKRIKDSCENVIELK